MTGELTIPTAVIVVVIAVFGWLLRRAISGVDETAKHVRDDVHKLHGKHDALAKADTDLLVQLVELRVRAEAQDRRYNALEIRLNDLSGFLSRHGFEKRDSVG